MATTTQFSLPNSTVWNAGTTQSPDFTMPSTFTEVSTVWNIQNPGLTDPTLTMTFSFMVELTPGSGVFTLDQGFTWVGNSVNPKTGVAGSPAMITEVGPLAGLKCHIIIVLSKSMTAGVTVTTS